MKRTYKLLLLASILFGCATIGYFSTHRQIQKKYKAIIFDMDGTTLDTDHLWKSGNAPILDSHAPHLTQSEKEEIADQFHKLSIYDVWKCVQGHCSIDISAEEIIQENIKHLHVIYETQGIKFIPYFHDFHLKVKSYDLKTAIATSSQGETIDIITRVVPLKDYFGDHIYHADHVNRVFKPQPDVYLYAAKMLGVQPCDCIAIEDSSTGIKAAKAAGMYCIGINTGKNRANLQLADEIVECFTEINLDRLLK